MMKILDRARKIDADRLIAITFLKKESGFALYYHFSKDNNPKMKELRMDVSPDETVESMIPLYANAELFEAEVTEMYGVKFEGNPASGKRLFLEEK